MAPYKVEWLQLIVWLEGWSHGSRDGTIMSLVWLENENEDIFMVIHFSLFGEFTTSAQQP
jgi:hypothetical protein